MILLSVVLICWSLKLKFSNAINLRNIVHRFLIEMWNEDNKKSMGSAEWDENRTEKHNINKEAPIKEAKEKKMKNYQKAV